MITFKSFLENIIDIKRNPKPLSYHDFSSPEDDDYIHTDDTDDGDEGWMSTSPLGITAQYPLAQTSGKLKGFQVKPSLGQTTNVFKDKLKGQDKVHTLLSKVYADEKMTMKEINYLIKYLNNKYGLGE